MVDFAFVMFAKGLAHPQATIASAPTIRSGPQKFIARHPNLVALEMSSFKCGHDAPIYGVIEGIIEKSGTPYFSFKDLDENKPTGSIKIRVETIDYFLRRYREDLVKRRKIEPEIDAEVAGLARRLEGRAIEGAEVVAAGLS